MLSAFLTIYKGPVYSVPARGLEIHTDKNFMLVISEAILMSLRSFFRMLDANKVRPIKPINREWCSNMVLGGG